MHAIDLAALASTFARCAPALAGFTHRLNRDAIQAFWLNSRFRHDNWIQRLATHRAAIQECGVSSRSRRWHEVLPVIQEVLMSEPLTRLVAYHAAMLDERAADERDTDSGAAEFAALTQSVFSSHIEARHRCLHLIVFGQGLSVEHAVKLNRFRRTLEGYTDQLLAGMPPIQRAVDYAFNANAVSTSQSQLSNGHLAEKFLRLHTSALSHGLWNKLQTQIDWRSANGRLNYKISQAILSLLPLEVFDSLGVIKTHHQLAFERPSNESSGKCDDFMKPLEHPLNVLFSHPRTLAEASKTKPRW